MARSSGSTDGAGVYRSVYRREDARSGPLPVRPLAYAGATAAASAANGLSKGLLAAVLSVSNFGAFAVGQTILMYASMFCEFGLFLPAARACCGLTDTDEQHEIIGAAFVLYLSRGGGLRPQSSLTVSLFVPTQLFHVDVAMALRITAPFRLAGLSHTSGLQLRSGCRPALCIALTSLLASAFFFRATSALGSVGTTTVEVAFLFKASRFWWRR